MEHRPSNSLRITLGTMTFALSLWASACDDDVLLDNESGCDGVCNEGDELSAVSDLVGKKYILDIGSAEWTSPAGLGEEIAKVQPKFAFEVMDVDTSSMTFTVLLGSAKNGIQDSCNKTYLMPGTIDSDEATFTLGPMDIQTIFEGPESKAMASSHGFTLTGQFTDQGAGLDLGTLKAQLDTREIYPLFYQSPTTSGEELCAMLSTYGLNCEECSFEPGAALCLAFQAEDFSVSNSPDLVLTEIPEK